MAEQKLMIDELMENIEENEVDYQLKEVCDTIQKEEDENTNVLEVDQNGNYIRPEGPNIFLTIPCQGSLKRLPAFMVLEREFPGDFNASLWYQKGYVFHRSKVWNIREHKPKKILSEFSRILKMFGRR